MSTFDTALTRLCGIKHPIIQGGWVSVSQAVSRCFARFSPESPYFCRCCRLFTKPGVFSMHYVGYADMAAAVSNAGGLGIITALTVAQPQNGGAEALRTEVCPHSSRALPNYVCSTL